MLHRTILGFVEPVNFFYKVVAKFELENWQGVRAWKAREKKQV